MIVSRVFDRISVEEYLEAENEGEHRHEYFYGEIYALAGASVAHNLINVNITTLFKLASKGTRS
jgi:Uma2 family endonuclease